MFAVKKSGETPPSELFAACNQQLHCNDTGCAAVYQAEGRYKDVFVCHMRWLCDRNAVECRVAQDFESAHQDTTASGFLEMAKLSPSEIVAVDIDPWQTCPPAPPVTKTE